MSNFALSNLYDARSKWTPEQKMEAAVAYVCTGSAKAAATLCEVPRSTISSWVADAEWWPDAIGEARRRKQKELDGKLTGVIDSTLRQLQDRIANGDEVVGRNGEVSRKKVGARDLAIIAGTMYDKRALLRGDPTSRSESTQGGVALQDLQARFAEVANQLNAKVINNEPKSTKEDITDAQFTSVEERSTTESPQEAGETA